MKRVYSWLAALLFIAFLITLSQGIDKITGYRNVDGYPGSSKNAYVGGDAYNYIINAGYATAYFVLASGAFVSSIVCLACRNIIAIHETIQKRKKTSEENERIKVGTLREPTV